MAHDCCDVCLVVDPARPFARGLGDLVDLLVASFNDAGVASRALLNTVSTRGPTVLLGYHRLQKWPASRFPIAVYQLEQLSVSEGWLGSSLVDRLGCADKVWDYSERNCALLRSLGLSAIHVPIGYSEKLSRIGNEAHKPIDVLFYGSLNERRRRILDALSKKCRVEVCFGAWGAARDALIARSKIVLNLHFYSMAIFEAVRVGYLINNGIFVVSEDSVDCPHPHENLRVPYDELVTACLGYLADPDKRGRLAHENRLHFATLPMHSHIRAPLSALLEE